MESFSANASTWSFHATTTCVPLTALIESPLATSPSVTSFVWCRWRWGFRRLQPEDSDRKEDPDDWSDEEVIVIAEDVEEVRDDDADGVNNQLDGNLAEDSSNELACWSEEVGEECDEDRRYWKKVQGRKDLVVDWKTSGDKEHVVDGWSDGNLSGPH